MKVVFLDVDGVCNTPKEWGKFFSDPAAAFNRGCVTRLNVLAEAGAKFVISSTWRLSHSPEEIAEFLVVNGFEYPDAVIGATPVLHVERGREIQLYLDGHPEVEVFVILDDDADMVHLDDMLVRTDAVDGLTDADVEKALEILK
jgi:hypothetical protein